MSNRPLYRDLSNRAINLGSGNTGLWYDKYCDRWNKKAEGGIAYWTLGENKIHWINQIVGEIGDEQQLRESCKRQRLLLQAQGMSAEQVLFFTTQWRFVTGLGRDHPVENGFCWHQTLGVPYLPGSSVKGMVRSWVEQWQDSIDDPEKKELTIRIFGPRDSQEIAAGNVIFLDALPIKPVRLEADIMTPPLRTVLSRRRNTG
jgi:CRISPR-associated protein Cmr6